MPTLTERVAAMPLPVRHAALVLAAGALSWLGTEVVPWLEGRPGWGAVLALALTGALASVTPLVQGYGLGTRTQPAGTAVVQLEAEPYQLRYLPAAELEQLRTRLLEEYDRRRANGEAGPR